MHCHNSLYKVVVLWLLLLISPTTAYHVARGGRWAHPLCGSTNPKVEFEDHDANFMMDRVEYCSLDMPNKVSICTSYVKYEGHITDQPGHVKESPIVLLHGFDSSFLEFRRIAPLLRSSVVNGVPHFDRDIYVPDILGWGFGDYSNVTDFSPTAKLEHLRCFIQQVVKQPCILVGASLGGGIAVKLATETCPELVEKVVLIDAQAFIDGVGPTKLPIAVIRPLVRLLKSYPLRWTANYLSYRDKKTFATADALRIGSAHCDNTDWERASINFVQSGGFIFGDCVSKLTQKTLLIWGRYDQILDPKVYPAMFMRAVSKELFSMFWVEECGHVPHLEKPAEVAAAILHFLGS